MNLLWCVCIDVVFTWYCRSCSLSLYADGSSSLSSSSWSSSWYSSPTAKASFSGTSSSNDSPNCQAACCSNCCTSRKTTNYCLCRQDSSFSGEWFYSFAPWGMLISWEKTPLLILLHIFHVWHDVMSLCYVICPIADIVVLCIFLSYVEQLRVGSVLRIRRMEPQKDLASVNLNLLKGFSELCACWANAMLMAKSWWYVLFVLKMRTFLLLWFNLFQFIAWHENMFILLLLNAFFLTAMNNQAYRVRKFSFIFQDTNQQLWKV